MKSNIILHYYGVLYLCIALFIGCGLKTADEYLASISEDVQNDSSITMSTQDMDISMDMGNGERMSGTEAGGEGMGGTVTGGTVTEGTVTGGAETMGGCIE